MFKYFLLFLTLTLSLPSLGAYYSNIPDNESVENIIIAIGTLPFGPTGQRELEDRLESALKSRESLELPNKYLNHWLQHDESKIDRAGLLARVLLKKYHEFYFGVKLCNKMSAF